MLAKDSTEVLLLILLSTIHITELDEKTLSNIKSLLDILLDTLLIPYIHLTEREEAIWNKETEKQNYQYNIGEYLVNDYLRKIQENKNLNIHYKKLFELFDEVKTAEWPYERK